MGLSWYNYCLAFMRPGVPRPATHGSGGGQLYPSTWEVEAEVQKSKVIFRYTASMKANLGYSDPFSEQNKKPFEQSHTKTSKIFYNANEKLKLRFKQRTCHTAPQHGHGQSGLNTPCRSSL